MGLKVGGNGADSGYFSLPAHEGEPRYPHKNVTVIAHMYVRFHVGMYICVYVYIHVHTHTHMVSPLSMNLVLDEEY